MYTNVNTHTLFLPNCVCSSFNPLIHYLFVELLKSHFTRATSSQVQVDRCPQVEHPLTTGRLAATCFGYSLANNTVVYTHNNY